MKREWGRPPGQYGRSGNWVWTHHLMEEDLLGYSDLSEGDLHEDELHKSGLHEGDFDARCEGWDCL